MRGQAAVLRMPAVTLLRCQGDGPFVKTIGPQSSAWQSLSLPLALHFAGESGTHILGRTICGAHSSVSSHQADLPCGSLPLPWPLKRPREAWKKRYYKVEADSPSGAICPSNS